MTNVIDVSKLLLVLGNMVIKVTHPYLVLCSRLGDLEYIHNAYVYGGLVGDVVLKNNPQDCCYQVSNK